MTLDAAYPIALLPVRLETRFAGPTLLQVRIFPDDIWADTHEPELTAEELADGTAYVAAKAGAWPPSRPPGAAGLPLDRAPRRLDRERGRRRIAAVAGGELDPGGPGAAARPVDRARLPGAANEYTVTSSAVRKPLALTLSPASPPPDQVTISDGLDDRRRPAVDGGLRRGTGAGMAVTIDLTRPDKLVPGPRRPVSGVDLLVVAGVSEAQAPADGAAQLHALLDAQHYTRGLAFLPPGTPTNNTPAARPRFPRPTRAARPASRSSAGRRWRARPARPALTARPSPARSACRSRRASRSPRSSTWPRRAPTATRRPPP